MHNKYTNNKLNTNVSGLYIHIMLHSRRNIFSKEILNIITLDVTSYPNFVVSSCNAQFNFTMAADYQFTAIYVVNFHSKNVYLHKSKAVQMLCQKSYSISLPTTVEICFPELAQKKVFQKILNNK